MADLEGYLQPDVLPIQSLDLTADAYEDLELDLVNVLENIVDPNTKMLRDLKIDDRDFPEFPNISDFFLNKRGLSIRPFSRQLWILMVLLHEYCPDCSDKKIASSIFNVPIAMAPEELSERMRPLKYGKCTKCGKTKLDFFKAKKLYAYQELAALLGQRTGKSTMLVAPLAVYVLHKYMKMPRPWEMYGLNPTTLFGTVVAQTYQAAAEQLWIPIKTYIEASPWFIDYHGMLKDHQERSGEELFAFLTTQLHYKHRALMIYPSGPNRKTLRGKTRFFSATDEHDFFDGSEDSEKVKMNGKEVRASLNNSLTNVRIEWRNIIKRGIVNAPGGYSMYVSSPDHAMGVLTQLVKAKEHSKTILAMHLATWDVHPKFTRAAIIRAFDPDPMRLERDFGACPPLNTCPFIEDPETINRMVDPERPNRVQIEVSMEVKMDRARLVPRITKTIIPQRQKGAVLALDAGFSNNSFAMALMSPPLNDKGGLKAVVQALVEMMINKKKKGTVDFHEVYEQLIKPIILQFNVRALVADRWNSLKILHDAQAEFKIHVEQYSLKYADFQNVRSYMESAAIHIPKFGLDKELRENPDLTKYPECFLGNPVDHFYFQSLTVRDLGKTVDKGPGMTDDLWRAFVLGGHFVLDKEFASKHLRGSEARRAAGGIAAGSFLGSVQGYGNSAPVVHTPGRIVNQSPVAASSGGIGGQVVALTPGVFARTPKN